MDINFVLKSLPLQLNFWQDVDNEKQAEKYYFGSGDFGTSPTRTESPQADSSFPKNSRFSFEDSVPGSPLSYTSEV